jgi:hypothetical protein
MPYETTVPSSPQMAVFSLKSLLIASLLVILIGAAFFSHPAGRWTMRWILGRTQKRTVESVVRHLEPKMRQRFGKKLALWTDGQPLALLAFKHEQRLELWKKRGSRWHKIRSYPFTAFSGRIGPKLREGDLQIPEGIYKLTFLHPNSQFYLSLKINYPNAYDRQQARLDKRTHLGGEIFIHGDAVTIGCVPIGDDAIEEVFYIVAQNGQYRNNRVIFAPYDLRKKAKPALQTPALPWLADLYTRIARALEPYRSTP